MKPLNQITPADIADFVKKVDKKTWVKIGTAAGAGLLLLVFVIWPAWVTRIGVKSHLREMEGQILNTQNLLRRQHELNKNKELFLKQAQGAKGRLFQPGEASLLLGAISKMAEESGVSIVASSPQEFKGKFPPPFDARYQGNLYNFTVEGGYHDLAVFISKIESNVKLLRVQTCAIRPQEDNPTKHFADISLTAVSIKPGAAGA